MRLEVSGAMTNALNILLETKSAWNPYCAVLDCETARSVVKVAI